MEVLDNATPATGNVLEVRALRKVYGGREILHGISFDVRAGEFLSILGPSGCGKTTTLRLLIGLETADGGTITAAGKDLTRLALRADLKQIQAEFGTTMIYITHDQEEAFALSDRVMVMHDGAIEQLGTPEELLSNPASDYIRTFVIDNLSRKIGSLKKFMQFVQ